MSFDSAQRSRLARRKARAEAAAWIVRLHGPERTPALEGAFRRWLAADQENARQFERVTEVWDGAASLRLEAGTQVTEFQQRRLTGPWLRAAVVLFVCGLLAYVGSQAWRADTYHTQVGEQRTVRLQDGSSVALNSRTRIAVKLTSAKRCITLESGEAYFEVAHDALGA